MWVDVEEIQRQIREYTEQQKQKIREQLQKEAENFDPSQNCLNCQP